MGIAKLAYSADGDSTHVPADASGLLVNLGANNDVTVTNTVEVTGEPLATANQSSVADSAADVQLLAANAARKKWGVTNDSTAVLYISYDGAASLTNYFVQVPPNSFFSDEDWVGEVRGIWASDPGTGAARLVEIEA
jgi:hypothetical protein